MSTQELLLLLASGLGGCGLHQEASRIRRLRDAPIREIVDLLSELERALSNIDAWKAVVLCKAALIGKPTEKQFVDHVSYLVGLS